MTTRAETAVLTLMALLVVNSSPIEGAIYRTVDFSSSHNYRMQEFSSGGAQFHLLPEGNVTLGGIPFAIPEGGHNVWWARVAEGPNPRTLSVIPNIASVTSVYLLINTSRGSDAEGLASLEFEGSGGASYTRDLVGGTDIRDVRQGAYTNTILSPETINVFTTGIGASNEVRLDMVIVELPSEFSSQTLQAIRVLDSGDRWEQRMFVAGITVASPIPEPTSLAIWSAIALGGLGLAYRRRKRQTA